LRFFLPYEARLFYGVDRGYVVVPDYPADYFAGKVDFISKTRSGKDIGVVEISLRGEIVGGAR
jgi:hypothetical protein